jgi:predicted outer membrane repeat protein
VTDDDGGTTTDTTMVTVTNVAPTFDNVQVTSPIDEGDTATLTGSVVDPGIIDTFTLDIDWGDPLSPGNTQTFVLGSTPITSGGVTWDPTTGEFAITHQYLDDNPSGTAQGSYTIQLGLSDNDQPQAGVWTAAAPILTGFHADGGAVLNDQKWYLVEVKWSDPKEMKLEAYDPLANTWSPRTAPPTVRAAAGMAGVGDKLYVIAGWLNSDSNTSSNLLEIYNATTNQWTTGAAASRSRGSLAAAAIGTKIYVTGGRAGNGSRDDATLEIYNTETNAWSTGAPLPTPRENVEAVAIGGRMYVVGGFIRNLPDWNQGEFTGKLEIYDPATNQWTTGTPMPTPRWDPAVAVVDGKLYAAGGMLANYTVSSVVEVYDPASNSWSTAPSMPTPRWSPQGAALNGKFYAAGGTYYDAETGSQLVDAVEVYTPAAPQATTSVVVTVNNVAPQLSVPSDSPHVAEGTLLDLPSATFTDPGILDTHTATIDWGDGTVESGSVVPPANGQPGQIRGSHVYADNGEYTVTVTVTDDDGEAGTESLIVNVAETPSLVVTTGLDIVDAYDGLTSLREAVAYANTHPGDDTVSFAPALSGQTIELSLGELSLTDTTGSTTIVGLGTDLLTIDGNHLSRVFNVATGVTVEVSGLTITAGSDSDGGGILNAGTLTLRDCTVSDNSSSGQGGGIFSTGPLTLQNCTVTNNASHAGPQYVDGAESMPKTVHSPSSIPPSATTVPSVAAGSGPCGFLRY